MKKEIRNFLALGASFSLVALTGCGAIAGGGSEDEEAGPPPVEEVPALSEIEDQMWDTMSGSGSVTMTVDASEFIDSDPETSQMFEQMTGADLSEIQFYGSLDETATAISIGDEDLMRNFGEDGVYISADAIFNMLEGQNLGLSEEEQQQYDDIVAEFEGTWFDYSSEIQEGETDDVDISVLFEELQQSWGGEDSDLDSPIEREEISDEGTHEVREEQDVWVYAGSEEGQELVVAANHDSPRFLSISDEEASVEFSDWDETEVPEQPADEDIMTEEDVQQQMGGTGGGGMSPENGASTEPTTEPSESTSEPSTEPTESSNSSESESTSGTVSVPGVGSINCDGPIPGDPGFTDPNGNYTDEQIQAIQDACDGSGSAESSSSGSSSDTVSVPGLGSFDCSGEIPGDPGVSTLDDQYSFGDLMQIYEACDRPGEPHSAMDNEEG